MRKSHSRYLSQIKKCFKTILLRIKTVLHMQLRLNIYNFEKLIYKTEGYTFTCNIAGRSLIAEQGLTLLCLLVASV